MAWQWVLEISRPFSHSTYLVLTDLQRATPLTHLEGTSPGIKSAIDARQAFFSFLFWGEEGEVGVVAWCVVRGGVDGTRTLCMEGWKARMRVSGPAVSAGRLASTGPASLTPVWGLASVSVRTIGRSFPL